MVFIELELNQEKKSLASKTQHEPLTGETLTNRDINEYFGQTVCYPRDVLNKLDNNIYVINSDHSSGKGKHWVALYNGDTECFYFDSFGVRPLPEVESAI